MLFYPHYTIVVTLWLVYQQHAVVINGECHDIAICQELNNLIPEPTDVTIQSRSFNQTDPDYNKLLETFYIRKNYDYSLAAEIDCLACDMDGLFRIVRTEEWKLILESYSKRKRGKAFIPEEDSTSDLPFTAEVETALKHPAFRGPYISRPMSKQLKIANTVLHGLCAILLAISALITIRRG